MASVTADPRERVSPDVVGAKLSGFWTLIATQFQGAFSDNTLKWLVSFLVLETAATKEERDLWFVLIVPLLFSMRSYRSDGLRTFFAALDATFGVAVGEAGRVALTSGRGASGVAMDIPNRRHCPSTT